MRFNEKYHDLFVSLAAGVMIVSIANAQTCDSILGGANCGAARPGGTSLSSTATSSKMGGDWDFGGRPSSGGLGVDLSSTSSSDTGFFGAITFGGGGTTCSGPFRSRRC